MIQNLTQGNVWSRLVRFALPVLGANVLQSFYNVVDMLVVGRFLGSSGLAGVSSASSLCYLLTALCSGLAVGGSVLVSQRQGAGDGDGLRRTVGNLFSLSLAAGLFMTLCALAAYRPILGAMRVPADALPHATGYMAVVILGTVFVLGYNAVCQVLRGLGDSKSPLVFIGVATVVNVLLDLLLVGPCGMGAAGAALATVLAQAAAFAFALLRLFRQGFFAPYRRRDFRPDLRLWGAILRIGLPTAVQLSVVNFSYLMSTAMFNVFGTVAAAAAGIGLKVSTFSAMPTWAVGTAVTAMAGQCVGAEDPDRAAKTARLGVGLALLWALPVFLFLLCFAGQTAAFFDPDPSVVAAGRYYIRVCASFNLFIYGAMYVLDAFATGVGAPGLALCNALLHSLAVRLFLSWLLAFRLGLGFAGLCLAEMLAPAPSCLVGLCFFLRGTWRKKRPVST